MCQVSAASKSDIHFNEPNSEVRFHIATALAEVADSEAKIYPRMELHSHANMVLLGKDSYIFDGVQGRTCNVQPFDPSLGTVTKVPIVDGAIAYDCQYTHKAYVLLFRNALHFPTLDHSLIPPFFMREAGITVCEIPKIHHADPTIENHAIYIEALELRIPLQLHGIFSYFHYRLPTNDEILHCDKVFLTPDSESWNPYSTHYSENEESMLNWQGDMMEARYRKRAKVDTSTSDDGYDITSVDAVIYEATVDKVMRDSNVNVSVNAELASAAQKDVDDLAILLEEKSHISKASMAIGTMTVPRLDVPDDLFTCDCDRVQTMQLQELDEAMVSSAIAHKPDKLSADFLSKIWHIKNDEAVGAINQSTQLCRQGADNTLSRQFPTNDRMLRYRLINSVFFTDTFFVTAKGKSTRGNTCAQIFASDKGFVMIYPMQSKSMFLSALKLFCKEVGVPETLISDPSGEHRKSDVKHYCHQVGTTLRLLQESTQWANRAELYVDLFKESIRQDLRRSNAPMVLWDYCAERRA